MSRSSSKKGGNIPQVDPEALLERSAELNRTGTSSPWATSRWTQGPGGQWTQEVEYTPEMQGVMDQAVSHVQGGPRQVDMGMNIPAGLDAAFGAAMTRMGDRMGTDVRGAKPQGQFAEPPATEDPEMPEDRPPPSTDRPPVFGGQLPPWGNPDRERPGMPGRRPF